MQLPSRSRGTPRPERGGADPKVRSLPPARAENRAERPFWPVLVKEAIRRSVLRTGVPGCGAQQPPRCARPAR